MEFKTIEIDNIDTSITVVAKIKASLYWWLHVPNQGIDLKEQILKEMFEISHFENGSISPEKLASLNRRRDIFIFSGMKELLYKPLRDAIPLTYMCENEVNLTYSELKLISKWCDDTDFHSWIRSLPSCELIIGGEYGTN